MKDTKMSIVIKEYYNIISPLLSFLTSDKMTEIERQVLLLLCDSQECNDQVDAYWAMIDSARCLQSYSDVTLLQTTGAATGNIAYDMKMDVLVKGKISKLRSFDENTFVEELKSNANAGDRNACKLLACLTWLGLLIRQNRNTAQNIWSSLAMCGDRLALEMLIYGYTNMGDKAAQTKWSNIRDILQNEFEAFSPVALYSAYPEYSKEEVQTANIIVFISRKEAGKEQLDRPMLYYALHSGDDYKTKMIRLSSETNYYLALHDEDRFGKKKYGF